MNQNTRKQTRKDYKMRKRFKFNSRNKENKKRTLVFYTSFHIYLPFIYLFRNKRKNGILLFFKERKNYVKKKNENY